MHPYAIDGYKLNVQKGKTLYTFYFSDVPGAPGLPTASDITPTSAKLSWTPPFSDGGSPITSYVVEMKDRFSPRWSVVQDSIIQEKFQLTNLKENNEYQFRVIAVNNAGLGEPSPAVNITAKYAFGEWSSWFYL